MHGATVAAVRALVAALRAHPAELPLGVCRNGRTFLQISWLLIADAPGRNHAVFDVAIQSVTRRSHRRRIQRVIHNAFHHRFLHGEAVDHLQGAAAVAA